MTAAPDTAPAETWTAFGEPVELAAERPFFPGARLIAAVPAGAAEDTPPAVLGDQFIVEDTAGAWRAVLIAAISIPGGRVLELRTENLLAGEDDDGAAMSRQWADDWESPEDAVFYAAVYDAE